MPGPSSTKPKKLLDQLRDAIRNQHHSYSTEKTYVHWAKRYILFHNKRHPAEMGAIVRLRPALDGMPAPARRVMFIDFFADQFLSKSPLLFTDHYPLFTLTH